MRMLIPSPLRDYTRAAWVQAQGATIGELLAASPDISPDRRMMARQDAARFAHAAPSQALPIGE
jgi:hypothetical protein